MLLTGSEIVIECLKEQGVDTVFGYPGGTILNVYDELYKHSDEIKHYLTSHEQGAAHAADGYARSTGKVGVCMATSGPGATNLVTGIATAYMDSIPVVAITANVAKAALGKDSFQEVDIVGVTMPITKHNFMVRDVESLADTLRKAFYVAQSGRPGPVLVDITKDATANKTDYTYQAPKKIERSTDKIEGKDIEAAVKLINKSKKPFIYVGGGCVLSGASDELKEFVEKVNAPVCDSLMGKGAFDGTNPLYTGMIGMHGTKASNFAANECDLLIAIGARFSDRVIGNAKKFASHAKVLHIDVDPAEINKNIKTNASVIGDVKEVLKLLNSKITRVERKEWIEHVEELSNKYPLTYTKNQLNGPYVMQRLYEITNGDAIITTEVGQNQMWAAQFYKYSRPRQLITSGGAGTMGYGLGAAIGTKISHPDKIVVNVAGDGCFRMNLNEIATASRYNVKVIELVLNNSVLGMVRQWQNLFYGKRFSNTTIDDKVDFVKVAEGLGAKGILLDKYEDVDKVLKEAIEADGPVVIDCRIDEDDMVFPMVAPGAPIAEAFSQEDLAAKGLDA
ncbi:MAG: biosynthetic-type acetolactate synthase large subunit [Lachnospiraceae bacterium]|nr:biosynthetic-type acetolactate synthase large subunit [Lachnospiraceae bacterium]